MFENLRCPYLAQGVDLSCDDVRWGHKYRTRLCSVTFTQIFGGGLVNIWKKNKISGLCEKGASSKVQSSCTTAFLTLWTCRFIAMIRLFVQDSASSRMQWCELNIVTPDHVVSVDSDELQEGSNTHPAGWRFRTSLGEGLPLCWLWGPR
jgi:hypothetical protein